MYVIHTYYRKSSFTRRTQVKLESKTTFIHFLHDSRSMYIDVSTYCIL